MEGVLSLETMHEGHDGSGMGLILKNLGGEFSGFKNYPILSGICSNEGLRVLDQFMWDAGFRIKYEWRPVIKKMSSIKKRDHYFAKVYEYPDEYINKSLQDKEDLLLKTRLALRAIGENNQSIIVFSFYPDVIAIKEVGDPLQLGEFFGLSL